MILSVYFSLSHSETDDESDTTEDDDEIETKKVKVSIKRQTSLRQKKTMKRATLKTERAALNISTASVELIRFGHKQRKIPTTEENMETIQEKELTVTNRLRSFRKSRLSATHDRQDRLTSFLSPRKCNFRISISTV